MDSPKVSIIIPVFNGERYLKEAIESALNQTYKNIECIVVDDGSIDNSWTIIQSYGSDIRAFHTENGGVSHAINTGIANAEGGYIAWLSHDDVFFINKIEEQIQFLQNNPQFKACYTDFMVTDQSMNPHHSVISPWYKQNLAIRKLFGSMYMNGSTMLMNKDCLLRIGPFNEKCRYTQDIDMWIRFLCLYDIGRVPNILLFSRTHPDQWSRNFEAQLLEEQSTFQNLLEKLVVGDLSQQERKIITVGRLANEYEWLGGEMIARRRWYQYAERLFTLSIQSGSMHRLVYIKRHFARIALVLFGSENESSLLINQGKEFLFKDDNVSARKKFQKVIVAHPLRLDAFILFLVSLLNPHTIHRIRNRKKQFLHLFSTL